MLAVVGVVMIVLGTVWTLQGLGALHGSPMTGARMWVWIGAIVGVGGLLCLGYAAARRRS